MITTTEEQKPGYRSKDDPRAIAWLKRYQKLKDERSLWESTWQDIANYGLPRKSNILNLSSEPNQNKHSQLFDTSMQEAIIQAAAGLMSWTTPANEPWFAWEPVRALKGSDATKQWLQQCSELARAYLAKSNFYTERHEDIINHVAFGTSALYVSREGNQLVFKALSIGTYCIAEDFLGRVDTLYREFELTARQAQQKFGTDRLGREVPMPECIAKCLAGEAKDQDKKFTFVHVVEPRAKEEVYLNSQNPRHKKFTDTYIEKSEKCIMQEDGYDAFPYMVGRWLKTGEEVWGESPAFSALPDARELNFFRKQMLMGVEKTVTPPYLLNCTLEGELNASAGGVTLVEGSADLRGSVYPMQLIGDLKWGFELLDRTRKTIETKFHVDFFQMFRNIDPKITATLTRELASERYSAISPALTRLVSEKDTPMLVRLFEMMASAGMLPPPPPEAIEQSGESISTPTPDVDYTSRIALAEKALQNVQLNRSFGMILEVSKIDPSVLNNFNWPVLIRDYVRNDGAPADWMRSVEEAQAISDQQAQAAAEMQKMEMMKMAGAGAKDLATAASTDAGKQLIGV